MGQKDEEMTTIVSIDEISQPDNRTPTSSENKTHEPPELITEKECQLVIDSCCTKKSVKPCIYSIITSVAALLGILLISAIPAYMASKFYDPKDSFTIILVILMFPVLLGFEILILVVLGFILVSIPMFFVYVYKGYLLGCKPHHTDISQ